MIYMILLECTLVQLKYNWIAEMRESYEHDRDRVLWLQIDCNSLVFMS